MCQLYYWQVPTICLCKHFVRCKPPEFCTTFLKSQQELKDALSDSTNSPSKDKHHSKHPHPSKSKPPPQPFVFEPTILCLERSEHDDPISEEDIWWPNIDVRDGKGWHYLTVSKHDFDRFPSLDCPDLTLTAIKAETYYCVFHYMMPKIEEKRKERAKAEKDEKGHWVGRLQDKLFVPDLRTYDGSNIKIRPGGHRFVLRAKSEMWLREQIDKSNDKWKKEQAEKEKMKE